MQEKVGLTMAQADRGAGKLGSISKKAVRFSGASLGEAGSQGR